VRSTVDSKSIKDPIMGWLRLVGSLKLQVSLADYSLFNRALLQKRPIIIRSLLIVATPQGPAKGPHKGPNKDQHNKRFICTTRLFDNKELKSCVPVSYRFIVPAESKYLPIVFS